jgi:transcriptional regulator with XRE-family HTH domain
MVDDSMTKEAHCAREADDELQDPISVPQFAVGSRLQAVRLAHGLSQRELARRARITNGSLSLIEQGKVSPSLGSLEKILNAIPMSLPEFFAESSQTPVVHQADEWTVINEGPARMRVMPLQHITERACYLVECELPARSQETRGPLLGRSGFAAGVIMDGQLEMRLDGVCYHLKQGDGFQFAGHRDQQFINSHEICCRFVLFVQACK